jgi:tetratricopeptide (TPR) repeat protein
LADRFRSLSTRRTLSERFRTLGTTAIVLITLCAAIDAGAQSRPAKAAVGASFDRVARRAAQAREAGRLDEAIKAYRQALRLRPRWDEGWWYLATTLYEQEQDQAARDAFTRFLVLKPETGAAFALRGICEFRLQRYDRAIADLHKAHTLGLGANAELRRAVWYHTAILLLRQGQFDLAVEPLTRLARSDQESASLLAAVGLLVLRLPYLPAEIPDDRRDLVMEAGRAGFSWLARASGDAKERFAALVERYPEVPYVHYAYGVFLLQSDGDAALAAFRREIAINPNTVYPYLEIAFELLRRGEPAAARVSAEKAVLIAPQDSAARNALGRALVELGELDGGIQELQIAVKLAPESPEMHFALANAYARAGRNEDAAREREIFQKLNRAKDHR